MKKNQIKWNHESETLSGALGLTEEQHENVVARVRNIVKKKTTVSEAAAELIDEYEEDPAKQVFALLILEATEQGAAMSSLMDTVTEGED